MRLFREYGSMAVTSHVHCYHHRLIRGLGCVQGSRNRKLGNTQGYSGWKKTVAWLLPSRWKTWNGPRALCPFIHQSSLTVKNPERTRSACYQLVCAFSLASLAFHPSFRHLTIILRIKNGFWREFFLQQTVTWKPTKDITHPYKQEGNYTIISYFGEL